jgi:hypothetical protein
MMIPPGRGVTYAVGVYEIPRLCDCPWNANRAVRPALYQITSIVPGCRFHCRLAHLKPAPKKAAAS